eukprot:13235938-Heterocapsa_arctica.AAC.1
MPWSLGQFSNVGAGECFFLPASHRPSAPGIPVGKHLPRSPFGRHLTPPTACSIAPSDRRKTKLRMH